MMDLLLRAAASTALLLTFAAGLTLVAYIGGLASARGTRAGLRAGSRQPRKRERRGRYIHVVHPVGTRPGGQIPEDLVPARGYYDDGRPIRVIVDRARVSICSAGIEALARHGVSADFHTN